MNQKQKIIRRWTANFLISMLLLTLLVGFVSPTPALAAIRPFGGPVLFIFPPIPFVCNFPIYIIGPPVPAAVVIIPGTSAVFAFASLKVGSLFLGDALTSGPCPGVDTVIDVGTSE